MVLTVIKDAESTRRGENHRPVQLRRHTAPEVQNIASKHLADEELSMTGIVGIIRLHKGNRRSSYTIAILIVPVNDSCRIVSRIYTLFFSLVVEALTAYHKRAGKLIYVLHGRQLKCKQLQP
ncbi:hypothetical protein Barb4_03711 [Bacteroidales bacterium Barb4]|nr:hypothetical protein Barb4_03711 [Bacteroidales bacterium Barb4]